MKQITTTKFTYTIDDLKKNLSLYHEDVLTNSVLADIKRCIIENHGIINDWKIRDYIEDNAPLVPIDFSSLECIKKYLVDGCINILTPEVTSYLEEEKEFDLIIVNSKGETLIHLNCEEIG